MRYLSALLSIVVATIGGMNSFAAEPSRTASSSEPAFIVGMGTHFGKQQRPIDLGITRLTEANVVYLRDEAHWNEIEQQKGEYQLPDKVRQYVDQAAAANVGVLISLNYGNPLYDQGLFPTSPEALEAFTRYAEFVARETRGKVRYLEIWNEWELGLGIPRQANGQRRPGKPEDYVKLAAHVYPRLKKINPDLIVLAGAASGGGVRHGWLEKTISMGLLNHCDGVSYHPYVRELGAKGSPEYCIDWVEQIQQMLRKYSDGKPVPMYITELGWPTDISAVGITPQAQAKFIARTMLLSRRVPELKGLWWFNLERSWQVNDEHATYGLMLPDATPMPALQALRSVGPVVSQGRFVRTIDTGVKGVHALEFAMPDGSAVWAAWSVFTDDLYQLLLTAPQADRAPLTLTQVGSDAAFTQPWRAIDRGESKPIGRTSVTVQDMPWLIRGDLQDVRLEAVTRHPMPLSQRPQDMRVVTPPGMGIGARLSADALKQPVRVDAPPADSFIFDAGKSWDVLIKDQPWQGPADLSGYARLFYETDALTLEVVVRDDKHATNDNPTMLWQGDSLQISLRPLGEPGKAMAMDTAGITELTIALVEGKALVYRQFAAFDAGSGLTTDYPCEIKRDGTTTHYRVKLPVERIGLKSLQGGELFAMSLLINDNDGQGRKGFVTWGGGVGRLKNPLLYHWVYLRP